MIIALAWIKEKHEGPSLVVRYLSKAEVLLKKPASKAE